MVARTLPQPPFALSLSKGLFVVEEDFAGLRIVGRGLPGGKFLFLLAREKEPKEGHPDIPETPKLKRAGRAAKNSPRFCLVN